MADLEALIERYVECYNEMNIPGMLECVSEDVVFENISNNGQSMRLQGKQAMGDIANLGAHAFTNRHQTITKLILDEKTAAAEVVFRGIAALDLPNGVKQGETLNMRGISIFEVENGLLTRVADYS